VFGLHPLAFGTDDARQDDDAPADFHADVLRVDLGVLDERPRNPRFHVFDARLGLDDDVVGLILDTFNDKRRAYELFFNPLGIQQDGFLTEGGNDDFSVDIVMESKGMVTSDGFTVEVAVPFKSLRYEAGKGKLWGVHILRFVKHANGETDSWMPISKDDSGFLSQAGHITGLEGISTERTLELIPSLTLSETGKRKAPITAPQILQGLVVQTWIKCRPTGWVWYMV